MAAILRGAPLRGESEQAFFAIFTLVFRKHTKDRMRQTHQRARLPFQSVLTGSASHGNAPEQLRHSQLRTSGLSDSLELEIRI
jgi:hypothetical protein